MDVLGDLKAQGRRMQPRNYYLKSVRAFTDWLVRDRRTNGDALRHLSLQNVAASFSKRRREDTQVLHPGVVAQLTEWLATKPDLKPDETCFLLGRGTRRHRPQDVQDDAHRPGRGATALVGGKPEQYLNAPCAAVGLPLLPRSRRPLR